jgi:hypothetical protein
LEKDFEHIEWGYAVTSHVAQSKTVDFEFLAQSDLISSGASNANQFYVSISRGRKGVKVVTDSIDLLRENIARVSERKMATEIVSERAAEKLAVITKPPVVKPVQRKAPEQRRKPTPPTRAPEMTAAIVSKAKAAPVRQKAAAPPKRQKQVEQEEMQMEQQL